MPKSWSLPCYHGVRFALAIAAKLSGMLMYILLGQANLQLTAAQHWQAYWHHALSKLRKVRHFGSNGRSTLTVDCSGSNTPSSDTRSFSLLCRRCSSEGDGVKCSGLPDGTRPCALLEGLMPFTPPAAEASVRQSTATEEDTHYAMSLDIAWRTLLAPPPFSEGHFTAGSHMLHDKKHCDERYAL